MSSEPALGPLALGRQAPRPQAPGLATVGNTATFAPSRGGCLDCGHLPHRHEHYLSAESYCSVIGCECRRYRERVWGPMLGALVVIGAVLVLFVVLVGHG